MRSSTSSHSRYGKPRCWQRFPHSRRHCARCTQASRWPAMREERKRKLVRYREISAKLQKDIRLGSYHIGNLLPTETELMARFSASRQTVREALRILADQGLIVRRAGLGSVVIASEPPVLFTHSVTSLTEWLRYSNETYRDVVGSREILAD